MVRCNCQLSDGSQCTRDAKAGSMFCWQHQKCKKIFQPKQISQSKQISQISEKSSQISKKSPIISKKGLLIEQPPEMIEGVIPLEQFQGNPEKVISVAIGTLPLLSDYYKLIKKIGQGGNSEIFLAKNTEGKLFAVKIPNRLLIDDNIVITDDLIIAEANRLAIVLPKLKKGPFLTFYGLFSIQNLPVIVMEYFKGHRIDPKQTQSDFNYLKWIIRQLFEGLNILHKQGFIHGDIHNGNMLVNEEKLVLFDLNSCSFEKQIPINYLTCQKPQFRDDVRTTQKIWLQIKDDPQLTLLMPKKDIYDAGEVIRELAINGHFELTDNPEDFKVTLKDQTIEKIINASLTPDPRKRPSAEDILALLSQSEKN